MLRHLNAGFEAPSRVVVLGAAGFVGSTLIKRLGADGIPYLALTRHDVDLLAPDAADRLAALCQPDDVFVAAAAMAPCKNAQMLLDNMNLAVAVVTALKKSPVAHVINISSDAVYADSPRPLTEESPRAPDTLHGIMHLAREIMFAGELGQPLVNLRPSLLYGAGDPHNGYGPNRFRRLANAGETIVLFGEGEERRDHVHIDDVATIIAQVIGWRSVGSLNIATGKVASFKEIAEKVVALAPRKVAVKSSPRIGPMPHNGYRPFDNSLTTQAFPEFSYESLEVGLAKAQAEATG